LIKSIKSKSSSWVTLNSAMVTTATKITFLLMSIWILTEKCTLWTSEKKYCSILILPVSFSLFHSLCWL
jgi:hypothetical protein